MVEETEDTVESIDEVRNPARGSGRWSAALLLCGSGSVGEREGGSLLPVVLADAGCGGGAMRLVSPFGVAGEPLITAVLVLTESSLMLPTVV